MQAWVVERQSAVESMPLQRREWDLPEPAAGEVRVRVLACGVCRTDLHIAEGDLSLERPVVPGHQIVGVVDALGDMVGGRAVGERVGVTWLAGACGACEFCLEGRENLCQEATFTGYSRHGGFAQFAVARAEFAISLPLGLESRHCAPLLCAGAIGYRSLKLAGVKPGERLGLVGFGASAHLALQIAKHWGCDVHVFTRGERHCERAREMGAMWAGGLEAKTAAACHAMVLFAPVGSLVAECLRHLRPGGTLAINAIHLSDIPPLSYESIYRERVVRSVSHLTRRDAIELVELAAKIPLRTEITCFPFAEANAALLAVKQGRLVGQAVLEVGSS
jgi:propanol-preferring alcohol dehydrogenase